MIKRDPGINMKNPNPVDYLLPGDDNIRSYVPGGAGGYSGGGNYSLSSPTVSGVPSYNAPGWGSAPVYQQPGIPSAPMYNSPGVSPYPRLGDTPTYRAPALTSAPTYSAQFRELPTYKAQKWDEGAIDSLTQKRAAPGLRQLRQQVQRVTNRRFDNPQVGRMTLRDALQGYGSGVSSVMGSASEAASGEYGQRYARESQNAQAEYQSQAAQAQAYNQYQSDVAKMNYQGTFAQWQAENQRSQDEAKMNYSGEMAKWGAESEMGREQWRAQNESAREAARMDYTGKMSQWEQQNLASREAAKMRHETSFEEWKAQNLSNERMAERNHEGALMKWKADTEAAMRKSEQENAYKLKEKGFEDAWERWKKQQGQSQLGYTWRPDSKVIQRQVRGY